MKNNYNKPNINQRKFTTDNGDIVIVAIKESWHKLDSNNCKIELIMGINGIEAINCEITRLSDNHFRPEKLTIWNRPNKYYNKNDWALIVSYMNNGMLSLSDMKVLAYSVLLDQIQL